MIWYFSLWSGNIASVDGECTVLNILFIQEILLAGTMTEFHN